MSFKAFSRAWHETRYSVAQKFILVALGDCSNEEYGEKAWPSQKHLAEKTGTDRQTVHRAIKQFEKDKIIRIERKADGKNDYFFNHDWLHYRDVGDTPVGDTPTPVGDTPTPIGDTPIPPIENYNQRQSTTSSGVGELSKSSPPDSEPPNSAPPPKARGRQKAPVAHTRGARFTPPSSADVLGYLTSKFPGSDCAEMAEDFVDYYGSQGWKVGKNPMKDWRLAANRWYRNNRPKTAGKGPDAVATPSRPRNRPLWAIKKDLQEEYDKTRYNFMYEGDDKKDPEGYARFKEVEKRLEQIKREERS